MIWSEEVWGDILANLGECKYSGFWRFLLIKYDRCPPKAIKQSDIECSQEMGISLTAGEYCRTMELTREIPKFDWTGMSLELHYAS